MDPLPPPKVKKSERLKAKRKPADLYTNRADAVAMRPAHLSATQLSRQSRLAKLRNHVARRGEGARRGAGRGRGGAAPPNNELEFEMVIMDHGTIAGINMNKNTSGTDPASDKVADGPRKAWSHTLRGRICGSFLVLISIVGTVVSNTIVSSNLGDSGTPLSEMNCLRHWSLFFAGFLIFASYAFMLILFEPPKSSAKAAIRHRRAMGRVPGH